MSNIADRAITAPVMECPACGSSEVTHSEELDTFEYSFKDDMRKTISLMVPVHHCGGCGLSFTLEDASKLRHQAVCAHLGVMAPHEVLAVRELYSLTQTEFSNVSGIGKASLARWEGGLLIQNQANDNLLYLLTFEENYRRLIKRQSNARDESTLNSLRSNVIPFRPKFRAITEGQLSVLQMQAEKFELYPNELLN